MGRKTRNVLSRYDTPCSQRKGVGFILPKESEKIKIEYVGILDSQMLILRYD